MTSSPGGSKRSIEEAEKVLDHPNKEGTSHQSELGPKAKRKHFFAPLDPAYADAVNKDAEFVEFTVDEEVWFSSCFCNYVRADAIYQRAVRKKIDTTVLPLVVCRFGYWITAPLYRN